MDESERAVVALSRARHGLTIIGDLTVLRLGEVWRRFIDHALTRTRSVDGTYAGMLLAYTDRENEPEMVSARPMIQAVNQATPPPEIPCQPGLMPQNQLWCQSGQVQAHVQPVQFPSISWAGPVNMVHPTWSQMAGSSNMVQWQPQPMMMTPNMTNPTLMLMGMTGTSMAGTGNGQQMMAPNDARMMNYGQQMSNQRTGSSGQGTSTSSSTEHFYFR